MDAFVSRVEPEHVHPARTGQRSHARRQRERDREEERDEPRAFALEPGAEPAHGEHPVPRSPHEDGLGDRLDVTA